ncbi:putative mitochondrial protein [Dendrobium catenatum]|uniref:Putative mitochondrial protein n=1 Tax=Dendrobium catenatum TaxID=906689 RepID=A0A2I0VJ80_9ASPA|nr:putative mitochondrial protein [Dendrobium catenatum]
MVIYMDDILLTGNNSTMISQTIYQVNQKFAMKDMGTITNFLGIQITRTTDSYFMSQSAYAKSILQTAGLVQCKPLATPTYTKQVAYKKPDPVLVDAHIYRQISRALQYLIITIPDIAYVVNVLCHHMHNPTYEHTHMLKKLLR